MHRTPQKFGWMEEKNRAVDGKRQADREFGDFFLG